MLIIVAGLPATGKSTLAKRLAKKLNAVVLNTDVIRKEIFPKPKYTEEEKRIVYDVLFLLTKYLLMNGINVILDGTFYKRSIRHKAYDIAKKLGKTFIVIECICNEDVVRERLKKRRKEKSISDADYNVYKKIKSQFEKIERPHIIVDTTNNIDLDDILTKINRFAKISYGNHG